MTLYSVDVVGYDVSDLENPKKDYHRLMNGFKSMEEAYTYIFSQEGNLEYRIKPYETDSI